MYLKCPHIYGIHIHVYIQVESYLYEIIYYTCYNSFHASGEFCRLPIAFCKQLNPDEDLQNIILDLDSNCLTLRFQVVYL